MRAFRRGAGFALHIAMTGEQLTRLDQNPFYTQAYEFFIEEATTLVNMLEEIGYNPVTVQQRESLALQCQRMKQTRQVLQQCCELVLPGEECRFIS